jgi:DNA helicase-2/ATP-dependent DNA helicase PcrA
MFKPSIYQTALFDEIQTKSTNILVQAVAGSGKTTSMIKCLDFIDTANKSVLMVAFNKDIAAELAQRAGNLATCKTFNSVGHGILSSKLGVKIELSNYKKLDIAKIEIEKYLSEVTNLSEDEQNLFRRDGKSIIAKLVGFAQKFNVHPDDNALSDWEFLIERFGIPITSTTLLHYVAIARNTLKTCFNVAFEKGRIDFDDQIYIPAIMKYESFKYDYIFVDESQDCSPSKIELLSHLIKPSGRIVAVGDRQQCIYSFAGSCSDSMDILKDKFNMAELPLSVSYRCGKRIVQEAQVFTKLIEPFENAQIGSVREVNLKPKELPSVVAGDVVLCRCNAPLVALAWRLFRNGTPIKILGKDIGKSLIKLIENMRAVSVPDLESKLKLHLAEKSEQFKADDKEYLIQGIEDDVYSIISIIRNSGNTTIRDIIKQIEERFDDSNDDSKVVLSSIHRSKGKEFNRVWLLNPKLIPIKYATKDWELEQEDNLMYVAITRAKEELIYLSMWLD